VEDRKYAVPRRVDLASVEAVELDGDGGVVLGEPVPPGSVSESRSLFGRADDVGHEQAGQHALGELRPDGRPCLEPRPVDHDTRLVADHPAVVARRDVVDVAGTGLKDTSVGEQGGLASRDDDADVARHAPFAADERLDVRGPTPTRRLDRAADCVVADLDEFLDYSAELDPAVRLIEVLL